MDARTNAAASLRVRDPTPQDVGRIPDMIARLAARHEDLAKASIETPQRDVLCPTPWRHLLVAEQNGAILGYGTLCGLAQLQFGTLSLPV